MTTVFFNLVTLPYDTTNDVEVRLYKTSSPNAVVASQSKPAPHPQTTWSFPGLDRTNYIVRIFDMAPVPFQIGEDFTVIPDNDTILFFEPVWIEFDVTPNPDGGTFTSGTNTFTCHAWHGRDIIFDRKGADTQDSSDITWDRNTDVALLQQPGDVFASHEKWFLEFLPLVKKSNSVGVNNYGRLWSERLVVTANTTLIETDISKKIIIKGATNYLVVTLPSLAVVADDVITWFESGKGSHLCVKIICDGSDLIDWNGSARNSIWLIPDESFEIYKETDDNGSRWRVQNMPPQYKHIGKFVSSYKIGDASIIPDDSTYSIRSYARLYEEFVKNLEAGQVCSYSDWNIGINKYKFSLADVESDSGVFHVPDLRGLFERNSDAIYAAAIWEDFMMEDHFHFVPLGELPTPPFGAHDNSTQVLGGYKDTLTVHADRSGQAKNVGSGSGAKIGFETRPVNYRTFKGILI